MAAGPFAADATMVILCEADLGIRSSRCPRRIVLPKKFELFVSSPKSGEGVAESFNSDTDWLPSVDLDVTDSHPRRRVWINPPHCAGRTARAHLRSRYDARSPTSPALPPASTARARDRSVRNRPAAERSGTRFG